MGKTPPKEEEVEGSPQKKAPRVDDAAPTTVPVASAPSPTGKTPPKGEEAEGSPRKKAPRLDDAALATGPGASEPNLTGETPPKEEAEGSPPKRSRSPRSKSPRRQDKRPAAALPLTTVPESSELIVEGEGRASDEKRCKCNHVITYGAIMKWAPLLESKDAWTCCGCQREKDKGIVKTRPEKSDLLICVTCYDHLCCGVGSIAYPFGYSRAHALKEKHWFAVLYCDPERGYCFKCNAEVPKPVKFGEGNNEVGLQVIRTIVSRKLLVPPPSVGQTEAEVNPKKVEMMGKVQAESCPSGFRVDLADKWPSYESRSSDAQGYAIKGIPNRGNTCYMSAVLQCLFVLGKLRERMLALDRPKGPLAKVLKELFLEASAAGDLLNPDKVLKCVRKHCMPRFGVGAMEDSHELLMALRNIWNEGEEIDNRQRDALTVIDSIFKFKMLQTLSCNKCGESSRTAPFLWDLKLDFPSKWHPTKSAASPQTSESPRSQKRETAGQLFPADVQRNLEKMQTVCESGYSHLIGSEVIVEKTQKPLEVDSTQEQHISQSKDVVQSTLQIPEVKSVDSLTEDSISIEKFLSLFSKEDQVVWKCPNCAKDHEEASASQSKNGEQIVGSGNEDDVGDTVKTLHFTMLPPVLTLHVNRTSHLKGTDDGIKISGHVRFMEDLDVERFMDPSSVDKGSTLYRLAGVVEHIGKGSLKDKDSHYIAYVRARRLGNQQEGSSCSSSWFRADDCHIRHVNLEQVLNSEAYILFYERMEDQDNSGMPKVADDILSCWEMIQSDEIVNCNADSVAAYELNLGGIINVIENNKRRIEMLQQATEYLGQFSPLVDHMLPIPVCSFAAKASSYISQAIKAGAVMGRALESLQSVISHPPSVGQTEAEVNPKKVEMTGKIQPESRPSGFGVDLADKWPSYESRSSDAQGYAIRGIPNRGNTCYMSAVLQCLFVLGKLQQRMFALDRPKGCLAKVLKELFVEASAAGGMLNPNDVLECVREQCAPRFRVGAMEDSHDLLTALRELWNQGEENDNWLSDAPTVIDSIFKFEMAQTLSCKKCGHLSPPVPYPLWDLSMGYPSKGHPTKSAALPQTNESPRSRNREIVQLFPADVQRNLEKMQTVSASGYSDVIGSEVIVEKTQKRFEVDSTEAQCISQRKDVVQSPLKIQEGKSVDSLTADSVSIQHFLSFFSEDHQAVWRCPNCAKDLEESSASQSKNCEQTVGSGNEDTTVVGDQIEQSDRTACHSKESECHGGILPAEKQTDLLGTNQSSDASKQLMMHLETVKQSEQARTAYLLKDSKNEQKDDVGDNIMFQRFTMLPPVLTLHLKRAGHDTVGRKISGHVRFMEDLDVKQFMDPSSVDKGSTLYRLAGVVEHIGKGSLKDKDSHYIAYVRARRLGNQQEGSSCSSSWFRADDCHIRHVNLEQVLNSEAYILFYERMEDQDNSGMPKVADDILSCWEMIQSDEIVNCNADSVAAYELNLGGIINVIENNKRRIEMLQQATEYLGQFSPLVDHMLPIPVCSFAAKASSYISQAIKAGAVMGRALESLQSVISHPEYLTVVSVANKAQAIDAVERWNMSGQPEWYFVLDGVDHDEARALKQVLDDLQAGKLLWHFHPELRDSE